MLLVSWNMLRVSRYQNCLINILETSSDTGVLSMCLSHESWKVYFTYPTEDAKFRSIEKF